MNRYEVLILAIPEITKDEESSIEKNLEKLLMANKGSMISFDRWGKYQLAYPVKSHDYGVYFLVRFEIERSNDLLKEIKSLLHIKFNDFVMRNIITELKDGQSLEYRKPQSLEDIPKKHVGLFDKKDSRGGYGSRDLDSDDSDEDVIDITNESDDVEEEVISSAVKADDKNSAIINDDSLNQDEVA